MIDALFGSKTRVKLLHLFMNHPGQSFYVREITRLIDEQINSVRRELSNMLQVGVITSDSADNKLYYEVNQRYDFYAPLRAIFANEPLDTSKPSAGGDEGVVRQQYLSAIENISSLRLAVLAGVLVKGSTSDVDVLLVGTLPPAKVKSAMAIIEKLEGREINYAVMPYDEFYYRLSVRDKFITQILNTKHAVAIDKDNVLSQKK
ncbi:transcriptional regulator [Candidatus Saccharibacteria bacterium]|nr:transcriptional regulator [Candidatus Saccharibacteria bacterium]MBJ58880.1 transcriptional regulator [Candidatus Saccharibacteria bacterium]MBQ68732.1 transcriptional regulator [Candidatus Saccharibacteria bacterium]